jgi:GR25 family glycosyltransferase involved in LPS biosynthesis
MEAFCINLDRQPEKFKEIQAAFDGTFVFNRVSAIDGKSVGITGRNALYQTNVKLFTELAESDRSYYIICEDDVYKYDKFDEYWPKIAEFINNPSNVWDFISLDFFLDYDNPSIEIYNDFLYKIGPSRSTGCMIYNAKFVKSNLDYLRSVDCLDMTMKHNPKFIKLIPKNLIVKQIVDKHSETACKNTIFYENSYNKTIEYLKVNAPETYPLVRAYASSDTELLERELNPNLFPSV